MWLWTTKLPSGRNTRNTLLTFEFEHLVYFGIDKDHNFVLVVIVDIGIIEKKKSKKTRLMIYSWLYI